MSEPLRQDDRMRPRVIEVERDAPTPHPAASGPRIITTETAGRIVPTEPAVTLPVAPPPRRRRRSLVSIGLTALGICLVGGLVLQAGDWIVSLYGRSAALGTLATVLLATGIAGAGAIAWHELNSLFMLRSVESIQRRLGPDADPRDAQAALDDLVAMLARRKDCETGVVTFQRQVQLHHSTAEQTVILCQAVIRPLDRRAESAIRKAALRAFGITALSPTSLTDAVFFVAVSLRMMREVAEAYGLRPTAASTTHLLRRLVREAGKLGAIDLATASLMQHLGGGAAERLSSAAAESLYAAQRMARLGIAAMQLTRPVPFAPDELPTLSSLVGGLMRGRMGEAT